MENTSLRQLENRVRIIGTLKSKDLEVKTSRNGRQYISGSLVVQSKFDDRIQELRVNVFSMSTAKNYKGIETVMKDFKSIEEFGEDEADRIRVDGQLILNEYNNSQGNLVSYNQIRGGFFNRIKDESDEEDKAVATIETIVQSFTPEIGSDTLPTGRYNMKGFTVGYNNDIIELKNVVVGEDLAQQFIDLYSPNSTGKITYQINNYAEVKEKEEEAPEELGFGVIDELSSNTITNFVSNIEVKGGTIPYFNSKEYSQEEIDEALRLRRLKLQSLVSQAPSTPQTGSENNQKSSESENPFESFSNPDTDGIPDFDF